MAPFLVDEDGKYPGEPPSPSDEASRERKLQRQRRYEALRREFSAEDAPPAPSSKLQNPPSEPLPPNTLQQQQRQQQQQLQSSSDSLYGDLDWDAEEAELNKQAEATKREMAKLQRKRNMLRFAKKQEELKRSFTEQLQVAKQQTERELQSRISAMRVERKERVGKVESFKVELKERIDALCRCYEEVSVRGVALATSFKEAEDKMIAEARNAVEIEKEALESNLRANLVELADKLKIDGV
ncbi:hypothetical protein TrRE_jg3962 [Triparma retinervis]|uniref:Uncharacterized protein n=1 Tax=Triparma retinervis TaxID=2557542 RepID=A0A9W6ZD12_9STRA|nr:hypothetical protein TrRE_jg3962 [Triparma retinervis]